MVKELILHLGDIAETLPARRFRADAWFLDGFSPAKNAGMWAGCTAAGASPAWQKPVTNNRYEGVDRWQKETSVVHVTRDQ